MSCVQYIPNSPINVSYLVTYLIILVTIKSITLIMTQRGFKIFPYIHNKPSVRTYIGSVWLVYQYQYIVPRMFARE